MRPSPLIPSARCLELPALATTRPRPLFLVSVIIICGKSILRHIYYTPVYTCVACILSGRGSWWQWVLFHTYPLVPHIPTWLLWSRAHLLRPPPLHHPQPSPPRSTHTIHLLHTNNKSAPVHFSKLKSYFTEAYDHVYSVTVPIRIPMPTLFWVFSS